MDSYRELKVWQLGMDVVVSVYAMTKEFPADEREQKALTTLDELSRMLRGLQKSLRAKL